MISLSPAFQETINFLGKQKYDPCVKYVLSRYVIEEQFGNIKALYSTLTGELIYYDMEEEQSFSVLVEKFFYVPESLDEYILAKEAKQYYRENCGIYNGRNAYTVFTTTNCNANCAYCYEKGVPIENMSIETAETTFQYMLANKGERNLYITWFGGEPLVNSKIIDYICSKLKEQGEEYNSDIITNAYLFDDETICKAKLLWNLRTVRVTIDGMNETYRDIKAYKSNDPDPLSKVLDNIRKLTENGIHVQIRLHIDAYNYSEINELTEMLCRDFAGNRHVDVYIHLLYVNHDYNYEKRSVSDRLQYIDKAFQLEDKLVNCGLLKCGLKERPMIYACYADCDNVYSILPGGTILKCRDYMYYEPLGNVKDGQLNTELLNEWKDRIEDEKCQNCISYPECGRLKFCKERAVCNNDYCYQKEQKIKRSVRYTLFQNGVIPGI